MIQDKTSVRITIEPGAATIIHRIMTHGYQAYAVGGCVRDALLDLVPHDWDICTDACPEEIIAIFGEKYTIPTGIKHGTVTVKYYGELYEVTTFRTEGLYTDGRHPDQVRFVQNVRDDLARRDFTVNAMAYNDETGLVDPFCGYEDLLIHHTLRAVGVPHERLSEDALRILRFYRFASRYALEMDPPTSMAAEELAPNLKRISAERIREEFVKLLSCKQPSAYLPRPVIVQFLPELYAGERKELLENTLRRVDLAAENELLRLACLLRDITGLSGEGQEPRANEVDEIGATITKRVLKRLRFSNDVMDTLTAVVRYHALVPEKDWNERRIQALWAINRLGERKLELLLEVEKTDAVAAGEKSRFEAMEDFEAYARELIRDNVCCTLGQLKIGGTDLMALPDFPRGKTIGSVLSLLLSEVIEGALENNRDALLQRADELKIQYIG